jgi:hypothetical protein
MANSTFTHTALAAVLGTATAPASGSAAREFLNGITVGGNGFHALVSRCAT